MGDLRAWEELGFRADGSGTWVCSVTPLGGLGVVTSGDISPLICVIFLVTLHITHL